MTTPTRRRLRVDGVTSNLHAFGAQPAMHLRLDIFQLHSCSCLESHYRYGLCVRGANQSPAIAEENADSIDGDHVVPGGKVFPGLFDDRELPVVGAIDANLRRRDEPRD